ncbi:hypothetical protein SALWKB12_0919 [Snodgrassella communis]|nr:hypothetical protein SALWKB12_0919 [Snodgrassella communis]
MCFTKSKGKLENTVFVAVCSCMMFYVHNGMCCILLAPI